MKIHKHQMTLGNHTSLVMCGISVREWWTDKRAGKSNGLEIDCKRCLKQLELIKTIFNKNDIGA